MIFIGDICEKCGIGNRIIIFLYIYILEIFVGNVVDGYIIKYLKLYVCIYIMCILLILFKDW